MGTDTVLSPADFAKTALGLDLLVRSKVALRQLAAGNRVGVTKTNFKSPETRRVEIAAALWHLLAYPDEDVVIVVSHGQQRTFWLADLTTVLRAAPPATQSEIAVSDGSVLTRFLGRGAIRWWVAGGKDWARPVESAGNRPLAIISNFDKIPGMQTSEILRKYAPPGKVLVTTYA